VSHTYLSLVIRGKKELSLKSAVHFASLLGLSREHSDALIGTAARTVAPRPSRSPRGKFHRLEAKRAGFLDDWCHVAILDLTLLDRFQPKVDWIAKELGISKARASRAIGRLVRLGLLEIKNGEWKKTHRRLAVPTRRSLSPIRKFHEQMIRKAVVALRSTNQKDYERRDITGTVIPVDPKRLPEAKKRIEQFRRGLMRFLSEGDRSELYQLNVQLYALTGLKGSRGKKR
jgi:uncharacterized protein (TIGR02147 family)